MDALRAVSKRESGGYLAHDLKEVLACLVRASGGLRYVIDQDTSDRLTRSGWFLAIFVAERVRANARTTPRVLKPSDFLEGEAVAAGPDRNRQKGASGASLSRFDVSSPRDR